MLRNILTLLGVIYCTALFSQVSYPDQTYRKQITLRHDNDFFMLTDYYYSSGLYLAYNTIINNLVTKNYDEQIEFKIGQEVYTPSQTRTTNATLFDRPYAGFLGLGARWSAAKDNHLYGVEIIAGIAGVNSGAGGFQRWYHKVIAMADSPIWTQEINHSYHSNLYVDYMREWEISPNPFGIRFAIHPTIAIGSRDIYLEPATVISFGRRTTLSKSIAFNRLGSNEREIYFAFRFGYRSVLYNGLIEGNLFGDSSKILRDTNASVFLLGFDFNHRFNQNDYKFGLRLNTSETPNSSAHKYVILSYGLSF